MTETFLSARWENLVMANYAVNPDLLKPYLPHGVELDLYKNESYVSLVGFMFKQTSLFGMPIPFLGTFEEVNLRFYVKRTEGDTIKRGVVFINETVPYKLVAWVANKLYREHYMAIPTKHNIRHTARSHHIAYAWRKNEIWNHLAVQTALETEVMASGSIEEFIFEHYYGYTKINNNISQEYKVNHARWEVNKVLEFSVDCDFESMYGRDFAFLSAQQPSSVIMAAGSPVTVDWRRTSF